MVNLRFFILLSQIALGTGWLIMGIGEGEISIIISNFVFLLVSVIFFVFTVA